MPRGQHNKRKHIGKSESASEKTGQSLKSITTRSRSRLSSSVSSASASPQPDLFNSHKAARSSSHSRRTSISQSRPPSSSSDPSSPDQELAQAASSCPCSSCMSAASACPPPHFHQQASTSSNSFSMGSSHSNLTSNNVKIRSSATSSSSSLLPDSQRIKEKLAVVDAVDQGKEKETPDASPASPSTPSQPSASSTTSTGSSSSSTSTSTSGSSGSPPSRRAPLSPRTHAVNELIKRIFGIEDDEKGHHTTGHRVITEEDTVLAARYHSDLLYGEVLPEGVAKMMDSNHLDASRGRVMFDLGMGLGKLAIHTFLRFPNLKHVVGVELAPSRCDRACKAIKSLANCYPHLCYYEQEQGTNIHKLTEKGSLSLSHSNTKNRHSSRQQNNRVKRPPPPLSQDEEVLSPILRACLSATTSSASSCSSNACKWRPVVCESKEESKRPATIDFMQEDRVLEVRSGNLFEATDAFDADIIICETKFPEEAYGHLCDFFGKIKSGCRILTYENIEEIHSKLSRPFTFARMPVNTEDDRFFTSWATNNGHRFHLWTKL